MEKSKNKDKILWRPALEVFVRISGWIAIPIILAVIAGKALDKNYNTAPWLLLVCTVLAFSTSSYGIVRAVKKYAVKAIKKEDRYLEYNDAVHEIKK